MSIHPDSLSMDAVRVLYAVVVAIELEYVRVFDPDTKVSWQPHPPVLHQSDPSAGAHAA